MKKNLIISLIILFIISFFTTMRANASEGIIELGNINGSNARCFIMSTATNRSSNFQLLTQCRNLIYPIKPTGLYYILWATPVDEKTKPINLGDLGFGETSFNTSTPFTSLFITREQTQSPNQPSSDKVMEGTVKSIQFLETEPTPTTKPAPATKQSPAGKITPSITPSPKPQGRGILATAIGFIMTFFTIVAIIIIIIIVIYVINKIRKSLTQR